MRKAFGRLNDEIILYGTSNDLVDLDNNFKTNLEEVLGRKMKKQELFRNADNDP